MVFTTAEFQEFLTCNGIRHITSVPYHPASNGLAERAGQTVKQGLWKSTSADDMETQISKFLFRYYIIPHSTTGASPDELLMGWWLRPQLDLILPNVATNVFKSQVRPKMGHDQGMKDRIFVANDLVLSAVS